MAPFNLALHVNVFAAWTSSHLVEHLAIPTLERTVLYYVSDYASCAIQSLLYKQLSLREATKLWKQINVL
jgi:hypothetical protein